MKLEKSEEQAVNRFKSLLTAQFGSAIVTIHLFGSKARGDAHAQSDIDLLVITRKDDWKLKEAIGKIATQILVEDGIYLSVKVLGRPSHQRFLSAGSPFLRNVAREGILL